MLHAQLCRQPVGCLNRIEVLHPLVILRRDQPSRLNADADDPNRQTLSLKDEIRLNQSREGCLRKIVVA